MARRYLVDPLPPPGTHRLPEDTGHHLARVLRVRAGDEVLLFDGRGRQSSARIVAVQGSAVEAEIEPAAELRRELHVALEIAFALPKGNRAEWLFEHATEVGVTAFRPVITARSDAGAGRRRDRWLRVVAAAAAQCDRSHVPEVFEPEPLAELLARRDLPDERYVCAPGGPGLGAARSERALLLVGPAGGLAADELEMATEHGFEPRGLGPLTLRTETAALAGAILLGQPA